MSNLLTLTSAQLIKAANLKDKIEALTKELTGLLGSSALVKSAAKPSKKKGMSAAGRAKIAAAQKARWAKVNAAKAKTAPKVAAKPAKKKFKMSAAAKAKISAAAKARWAKIKGVKK